MSKEAAMPSSSPFRSIANDVLPGEARFRRKCAENACRSSGSGAVNAAIRTATGSRIIS
jgi:hypothetical protein